MTLQVFVRPGNGYSHCAVPTVFSKRLAQRSGNNRGRCLLVIGTLYGKSRGESMILPVAVAPTTKLLWTWAWWSRMPRKHHLCQLFL